MGTPDPIVELGSRAKAPGMGETATGPRPSTMPRLTPSLGRMRRLGRRAAARVSASALLRRWVRAASRSDVVPTAVWRRLPVDLTFQVDVSWGALFLYRATPNDAIGRALYWRGLAGHEPETVQPFLEVASTARVAVDVGANTGVFTLLAGAANPRSTVIAFEPLPHLCDALRRNVELNGWNRRVRIFDQAVADRVGVAAFHVPRVDVPTSASLNRNGFRGLDGDVIDVHTTTLDASLGDQTGVDLVKIDVEGFEDKVLQGMTGILSRSRPVIVLECNPDGPHREMDQVLSDHRYALYHLGTRGPKRKERLVPDRTERCRNYLCVPVERGDWQ
jgi:FkbM family methyltransferase